MKCSVVMLASLLCACARDAPRESAPTEGTRNSNVRRNGPTSDSDQGGVDVFDAATPTRRTSSSERADAGRSQSSTRRAPTDAATARDSGMRQSNRSQSMNQADAALQPRADASSELDASVRRDGSSEPARADAGAAAMDAALVLNSGSCCSASDQPGCGDSAVQACVCAREPSCCDNAWTQACTRIVAEKFCQSGVRDCVCGNGEGQWQQAECCERNWDDTCESVAVNKCGATSECS